MRCGPLVVLALLIGAVAEASGQSVWPARPTQGDKLRITLRSPSPRLTGTLESWSTDSLVVRPYAGLDARSIPLRQVSQIQVFRGRRGHAGTGAAIGMLSAATATAVTGMVACEDGWLFTAGECRVITLAVGVPLAGLSGLVAGAIVGALIRTDRWEKVSVRLTF